MNVLFSKKADKFDNQSAATRRRAPHGVTVCRVRRLKPQAAADLVSVYRRSASTQDTLPAFRKSSSHQEQLNQPVHASGDGDCARCCRLCGGDSNLKHFMDTYVWEGVEERYDQLLYDCFGVRVTPSDCMICEWCVRALRNTEKFRALVHAAFDQGSASDIPNAVSSVITLRTNSCQTTTGSNQAPMPGNIPQLKKKPLDGSRKKEGKKKWISPVIKNRRINVTCDRCNQRYPMMISSGETVKTFICSRCKKNGDTKNAMCRKCNIMMPTNLVKDHMELHAKADLRAKARPRQLKKQSAPSHIIEVPKEKFQCSKCPKKYSLASNLAVHVKNAHGDNNGHLEDSGQQPTYNPPGVACVGDSIPAVRNEPTGRDARKSPPNTLPTECQLLFKNQRVHSLIANAPTR